MKEKSGYLKIKTELLYKYKCLKTPFETRTIDTNLKLKFIILSRL